MFISGCHWRFSLLVHSFSRSLFVVIVFFSASFIPRARTPIRNAHCSIAILVVMPMHCIAFSVHIVSRCVWLRGRSRSAVATQMHISHSQPFCGRVISLHQTEHYHTQIQAKKKIKIKTDMSLFGRPNMVCILKMSFASFFYLFTFLGPHINLEIWYKNP